MNSYWLFSRKSAGFFLPEDVSVARRRRLTRRRICRPKTQADPQTYLSPEDAGLGQQIRSWVRYKLLLSEKPVYSCFVKHRRFIFKIVLFYEINCYSFANQLIFCIDPRPSSLSILTSPLFRYYKRQDHVTYCTKRRSSVNLVNSSIAGNRSMNCWPVNRTVMQRMRIFWLTVKTLCICFPSFVSALFFILISVNRLEYELLDQTLNVMYSYMYMYLSANWDYWFRNLTNAPFWANLIYSATRIKYFVKHTSLISTECTK